jgi:hypothetical protein
LTAPVTSGTGETDGSRFDERLMPAGTNARFALLLALVLITSARMCLDFAYPRTASKINECLLAAGVDLVHPSDAATLAARASQWYAYTACESRYAPPPPWWLTFGWPVLILFVAVALFHGDRWLKASRVTPLEKYGDGSADRFVKALLARAGVSVTVELCYDRSLAKSAMVFGSTRKPALCLNEGLLTAFSRDASDASASSADDGGNPSAVQEDVRGGELLTGVVLHELAHIRYRDITTARASIAVWRAFLLFALIPYLIWCLLLVMHGSNWSNWAVDGPIDDRDLFATLALLALGYLARCDVLRSREVYADLDAVRRGADRRIWETAHGSTVSQSAISGNRIAVAVRRLVNAFVPLWGTHPRWNLRREALDDNEQLFLVQAVPVFLSGVAAALVYTNLQYFIETYGQSGNWLTSVWALQGASAFAAGLVAAVVAVALWRAAAHRVVTDPSRMPAGARTGLWLAAGMLVGDFDSGQGTISQLWPTRPEFLLAIVLVGVGFAWWTTQCARLWLARWRGRRLWPAMMPCMVGGFLLMSWWFFWWAEDGQAYAAGWYISPSEARSVLIYSYAGPLVHPTLLTLSAWWQLGVDTLVLPAVDLLAVAALWLTPLLAWVLPQGDEQAPAWTRAIGGAQRTWQTGITRLPSLRAPLIVAGVGAVLSWAAVAGAQAFMHSSQPQVPRLHGIYELTYCVLLFLAQLIPVAVVALIVGLSPGRYRLARTLIATEAAALAGFAGLAALVSADGCIQPLDTLETTCAWRPSLLPWNLHLQLDGVLVLGVVVSLVVAGFADTAGRLRAVRSQPRSHVPEQAAPVIGTPLRSLARRPGPALVALAVLAALGAATAEIIEQRPNQISGQNDAYVQSGYRTARAPTDEAAPSWERAEQVQDWSDLGGNAYISRLNTDLQEITRRISVNPAYLSLPGEITAECGDIQILAYQSNLYFTIPDAQANQSWAAFVADARNGAQMCMTGLAQIRSRRYTGAETSLQSAFQTLGDAVLSGRAVTSRISAIEAAGESSPPAAAPAPSDAAAEEVLGSWRGTYDCGRPAGMTLDITRGQGAGGGLDAELGFYAVAADPAEPSGAGVLRGTDVAGSLILTWQAFTVNPAGYIGIDLRGSLSGSGAAQTLSGAVTALPGGAACTTFSLTRAPSGGATATG